MLKKHFIFFLLAFAYSIVLAHNIVPHHHHDEHHNISCHQIEECSDKTEAQGLSHVLSFFPHDATDHGVFINHGSSNLFVKGNAVSSFLNPARIDFKLFAHSLKIQYASYNFIVTREFLLLSHSLRAPPSSLV